jgi:hypothetical protein
MTAHTAPRRTLPFDLGEPRSLVELTVFPLFIFTDLDGENRCFDLHARFTPGAGRIHFRLAPDDAGPRLVIAHVGHKL